jgi:GNAT superfamily N-acetyltransferase
MAQMDDAALSPTIAAVDANTLAAFARWGRLLGAQVHADADVTWFATGLPFQAANVVISARLGEAGADERIDDILRAYRAGGAPMAWLVGPSSRPASLVPLLEEHGLTLDDESPGMAIDLRAGALDAPAPGDVRIREVLDGEDLVRWIGAMVAGSRLPETIHELLLGLYARLGYGRQDDVRYYLASRDGRAVATALLFLGGGAAGVYCVATVPEARRQGIGAAMTLAALRAARELGYGIGVLQSSAMGHDVYRRLGFQECCRYRLYFG